jgi:hypothetical protein
VSECHQICGKTANDVDDSSVSGDLFFSLFRDPLYLATKRGEGQWRFLQLQALDDLLQVLRYGASLASFLASSEREANWSIPTSYAMCHLLL